MKMFNQADIKQRIGSDIKKSKTLYHLRDVEKEFIRLSKKHKIEWEYDVVAMELPYFKTMSYTEWAHSFMIKPLQNELRYTQWLDAYNDNLDDSKDLGWMDYWTDKITSGKANKYQDMKDKNLEPVSAIVVLVGSNKLKDTICANKMCYIRDKWDDDVYFKPHPLTTHQLVGELRDMLGEDRVLDRNVDLHPLLLNADIVYTSHLSESVVYAVALEKEIEPIDVYNKITQASFYHINAHLFREEKPKEWITQALRSPKCGIINPELDENWKERIRDYFEYAMDWREKQKNKYVYSIKGS